LSLKTRSGIEATPLDAERLAASGILRRTTDTRGGQIYDLPSNAPCSTRFAISRFLAPILAQTGWCLFADADVVFLADVKDLFALADDRYAVMCVKHQQRVTETLKMDGQPQLQYHRKNWTSVMLWNCDHPANSRLTLDAINNRRGLDLQNLFWLHDSEIGELPPEWNWLVGVQPMPADPKIAHFTLGGPFTEGWRGGAYDEIWTNEYERLLRADRSHGSVR
jgi:lipopolysaccharide biosynthesis glycosyltransferase